MGGGWGEGAVPTSATQDIVDGKDRGETSLPMNGGWETGLGPGAGNDQFIFKRQKVNTIGLKMIQMLQLPDRNFKITMTNMVKDQV